MKKLALISIAIAAATPVAAQTYSIGTNPQGSSAYATGAAVAKVVSQVAKMRARVVPQGGPVVTLPLVNQSKLDFSIANAIVAAFAHGGKAMFRKRPQKNFRIVAALRTLYVGMYVRRDSKIKTFADMKGMRVPSGYKKQKNVGLFQRAMLATAGLTAKDVKGVPVPNGVRGIEDLMSGKTDAATFSLTSGKTRQAHAAIKIRYLSIPKTAAATAVINRIAPGAAIETVMPAARFPGIAGPTNVMAAPFVITASAKMSDADVYKLVKTLHANKAKLVAAYKGMGGFRPDRMHIDFGVPYHPGAMKFFRETGQVK